MSSMEGMILGVGANNCGAFSLYVVESVYLHYRLLNQVFSSFMAGRVHKNILSVKYSWKRLAISGTFYKEQALVGQSEHDPTWATCLVTV